MSGFKASRPTWWTPSLSMIVPSAKTWRNMPNWLPSSERLSVIRVMIGSASVAGRDTRGRGTIRGVTEDPLVGGVEGSGAARLGADETGGDGAGVGEGDPAGVEGALPPPKRKSRPSRLGSSPRPLR